MTSVFHVMLCKPFCGLTLQLCSFETKYLSPLYHLKKQRISQKKRKIEEKKL